MTCRAAIPREAVEPKGCGDVRLCACGCGAEIKEMDDRGRSREYLRGHYLKAVLGKK